MDYFERFMYEELKSLYASDELNDYDYEELYERFIHLEYLKEVQPYVFAMRFLGKGTKAEPENVLKEMETLLILSDCQMRGLYNDMKLISGKGGSHERSELEKCISEGYSNKYLKEESCIEPEKVQYKNMIFEGCGYSGYRFGSADLDYICIKVSIEPMKTIREICVKSQIYVGDEPYSEVFYNEYTLEPGDDCFITPGVGYSQKGMWKKGLYRYSIQVGDDSTHEETFTVY